MDRFGQKKDPFSFLPVSPGLKKIITVIFVLPQILMGAIFTGVPLYLFVTYWWPAFVLYQKGEFNQNQSSIVLFGFLAFGGLFFFAGVAILVGGLQSLGKVVLFGDENAEFGPQVSRLELANARQRIFGRMESQTSAATSPATNKNQEWFTPALKPDGYFELSSGSTHGGIGVILLVFALFWNGLIGNALLDMVGWSVMGVIFGIFLLPFVLVGLGLLAGSFYFLSMLFYPKFTVRLRADPRTRSMHGTWKFQKRPRRLTRMEISLSIVEKQIDGTGDDATTKTFPILDQKISETGLQVMYSGDFSYRWSDNLELPFDSETRKVIWTVNFRAPARGFGEFRFWMPVVFVSEGF